jgi:uncharacterized protein (DUF4415 family)
MMKHKRDSSSAKGRTDWQRIARLTDAEIERMATRDPDNPGRKKGDWANAFIGVPPLKIPVNAKFDVDVVEWFKSHGRGYQARMNSVLRHYMQVHRIDDVYERCVDAIIHKRLLTFAFHGRDRIVCPHVLGHGKGKLRLLAFQTGGESSRSLPRGGQWRCFDLEEIHRPEPADGEWRTGDSHERPNTCITDVYIDVNPKAKQRFDWKTMGWKEPAL